MSGFGFLSRKIDDRSFAIVQVGDFEGIEIYRSNQLTAVTGQNGKALVTGLLPYQANKLSINADDLPLDVEINGVEEFVAPFSRTGVFVNFPVERSTNIMVRLQQANGAPFPTGAKVQLISQGKEFVVGKRGEAYLMGLTTNNQLKVSWKNRFCEIAIQIDSLDEYAETQIGPYVCDETTKHSYSTNQNANQ